MSEGIGEVRVGGETAELNGLDDCGSGGARALTLAEQGRSQW